VTRSFDPVWEESIYADGRQLNNYPFDSVVSFVFRHRLSQHRSVLEVGCGAGNNLWFAAREGLAVTGVDASPTALAHARSRFASEGLRGSFLAGDFVALPFAAHTFDLVIDRAALTCVGRDAAQRAVSEIHRVVRPDGRFFFNPYSDRHSSAKSGTAVRDGLRTEITEGTLTGVGQICFYGTTDIEHLLSSSWRILERQHVVAEDKLHGSGCHAEWRVVAEPAAP
jgi:ubiquinone/menaquinone biosynthesis C-methylase UbiE